MQMRLCAIFVVKMAPRMAAVLRAPGKLCSFSYVLFVFLLFYVLDVVSITVYDRDTLLNIGSSVAQRKPDFEFLNAGGLFTDTASEPFVWVAKARRRRRRRKRGKRAGVLVRLRRRAFRPPLPTILLANVQSLDNKLCELPARISYQRETRDCCVICLTETWMSAMVPDSAIELTGFSVHRSDRTEELTGKSRGGGVCFYINNSWCNERNIHSIKSFCSPDLEFHTLLCRPFWLPREFTAIIITAVYIPPQANTDQALKELYRIISEQESAHPDAAFVVTGDFNKANFRTIAPKYFQHVTINTRGDRTLDHCYSPFRDAYKSLPRPPFGKSDHSSVLLLPAYRQKLKREAPALRTVHCWSDQSDAILQDCFDHVDWDMFRAASDDDIEAYSDTVTCFIRKCIDDVVPTKTIRIYPNQKPWINSDVRSALSARTSAYKSGNSDDRKQASYDLRRSIKAAKRTYKNKVEEHFNNNNPRSMWQGINNITGFKGSKPATVNIAASLPDELNTFYARFEADNTAHTEKLVRDYICSVLPASLDPLQFAYRSNRSTDDAIAFTLHTALSHLENKNTYVRMLFVDYSSAFNTIVPATLVAKLQTLGLNRSLCSWILDFLTGRSQVVRMGNNTSSPLILNTGAPQGCVLSPLLYSLYTHDCTATHSYNVIVKFADDTTVIGLITDNDETAYREEVSTLTKWCQENHLSLNIDKTKELVVDYRRQSREHTPITIDKTPVERVTSFKFLGVHITEDLTWSAHTDAVLKKAHQRLFFLRRLRKFGTSPRILRSFYTCTVESILTGCITAWFGNSTAGNRRALQRVVRTARHIVGGELPSLQDIYTRRCTRKARRIIKDSSHPSHRLLSLLPSGRRFRSIRSRTSRLRDSFLPQAIRLMNSHK